MNCVIWSFCFFNKNTTVSLSSQRLGSSHVLYTQDYCNAKYTPIPITKLFYDENTLIFCYAAHEFCIFACIYCHNETKLCLDKKCQQWLETHQHVRTCWVVVVVTCCFTPIQPVWLYQGETYWESTDLCRIFQCSLTSVNTFTWLCLMSLLCPVFWLTWQTFCVMRASRDVSYHFDTSMTKECGQGPNSHKNRKLYFWVRSSDDIQTLYNC